MINIAWRQDEPQNLWTSFAVLSKDRDTEKDIPRKTHLHVPTCNECVLLNVSTCICKQTHLRVHRSSYMIAHPSHFRVNIVVNTPL